MFLKLLGVFMMLVLMSYLIYQMNMSATLHAVKNDKYNNDDLTAMIIGLPVVAAIIALYVYAYNTYYSISITDIISLLLR